ncbi:MAG: hypothetical protein ACREXM_01520 [Gammaproteobacteria bacterium]
MLDQFTLNALDIGMGSETRFQRFGEDITLGPPRGPWPGPPGTPQL